MKKILLLYVPVLHEGYLRIFKKYAEKIDSLYILGREFTKEFAYLETEIRAMPPETVKKLIESLHIVKSVQILDNHSVKEVKGCSIVTTREGMIERLIKHCFKKEKVIYDSIFLRWDEKHVDTKKPVVYDRTSQGQFDWKMITRAQKEGSKTSDWWREVGVVVVKNRRIILKGHNRHVPSAHTPYSQGDIRDFIPAGKDSHIQSALHAEKYAVAEAARRGISLEGASMYLSIFPCPDCAKVVAYSGIKKCYFAGGHASFDGEKILKAQGVELIFVKKPLVT